MLCEIVTPVFDLFCMRMVVVSVVAMGVASIFVERFSVALHRGKGDFVFAVDGDAIIREPYDRIWSNGLGP